MKKWFSFIFSTCGFCWFVNGANKYDNYTLIQVTPYNNEQLKVLKELSHSEDFDILKKSHRVNVTTDILVSPSERRNIESLIKRHGMTLKMKRNYGRYFETESRLPKKKLQKDIFSFDAYNSYDLILKYLVFVAKRSKFLVRLETIGTSYEGRLMKLIKISSNHDAHYPIIFIDAGAHAREWAAPAFALYIIERLTRGADSELGRVDYYILPVVNPDGYEYSRANPDNRMWRKTRSKTWRKECLGVDINRNFGYKWGFSGVSFDPCDFQIYAGIRPFSERETRYIRRIMRRYAKRIKLYISIHTYGDYLIYPWAYTGDFLPRGWKKVHKLGEIFSDAVVKVGGPNFTLMSAGQWYPSAGASPDFAFGAVRIPYSYVLEITDKHEFVFPANLLPAVLPQYYEGLKAMAEEIRKEFSSDHQLSYATK